MQVDTSYQKFCFKAYWSWRGSLQVCAGKGAGAEAAIHAVHGIFKDHTTEEVLLIYAENAFNNNKQESYTT